MYLSGGELQVIRGVLGCIRPLVGSLVNARTKEPTLALKINKYLGNTCGERGTFTKVFFFNRN